MGGRGMLKAKENWKNNFFLTFFIPRAMLGPSANIE